MSIGKIIKCLDRIHLLVQVSNVAYLMTEDDKIALAEAKEILENLEAENERLIKELEEKGLDDSASGSGMLWVSDAIAIVKRGRETCLYENQNT